MLETYRPSFADFLQKPSLCRRAGCSEAQLSLVAAKELIDNALDADPDHVAVSFEDRTLIVRDHGAGLSEEQIVAIFSVARESLSSKRWRLASRGALGNGSRVVMGVAFVSGGHIVVESRGLKLTLAVAGDGQTRVSERSPSLVEIGTRVSLVFGPDLELDQPAVLSYAEACQKALGRAFSGTRAVPGWFDHAALRELMRDMPPQTTVLDFARRFDLTPQALSQIKAAAMRVTTASLLDDPVRLRTVSDMILSGQATERSLKRMGRNACAGAYSFEEGVLTMGDAKLPCFVEVWLRGTPTRDRRSDGYVTSDTIFANRTPSVQSSLFGVVTAESKAFSLTLGAHRYTVDGLKGPCHFVLDLAITAPELPVVSDGKAVDIECFAPLIMAAIRSALPRAYRPPTNTLVRTTSTRATTIKGAVYAVIAETYAQIAQSGIGVPPRMLMYRCRPEILRLTERASFEYATFVNAVHDFMEDHPEETADWQLAYDDRGHFITPGGKVIGLGTQAVNTFIAGLGSEQATFSPTIRGFRVEADAGHLSEDPDPSHRFSAVCFIEKEGYAEVIRRSALAERFDVAFASTKGLPNTAIRKLLDALATYGIKVFCLHDFDIAGLTIANTLANSNRRYQFANALDFVDMGLRLATAQAMDLQSEPFEPDKRVSPQKLRDRLQGYGATDAEIRMLVDDHQRVEIDAMADPLAVVAFIEQQLTEHGITKIVPDEAAMAAHYQQAAFNIRLDRAMAPLRQAFATQADKLAQDLRQSTVFDISVPPLREHVQRHLAAHPTATWHEAVAAVAATIEREQAA